MLNLAISPARLSFPLVKAYYEIKYKAPVYLKYAAYMCKGGFPLGPAAYPQACPVGFKRLSLDLGFPKLPA